MGEWLNVAGILAAVGGGGLVVFQAIRSLGQYEQRFTANEKRLADLETKLGPDFEHRRGRDDERWRNLFSRLDDMDGRLDRIEQFNGKGNSHV